MVIPERKKVNFAVDGSPMASPRDVEDIPPISLLSVKDLQNATGRNITPLPEIVESAGA